MSSFKVPAEQTESQKPDPAPARPGEGDLEARLLARVAALAPAAGRLQETPDPGPARPDEAAEQMTLNHPDNGPNDAELEKLRRLLLGRDLDKLNSVCQKLGAPERLARTLSPAVTEALFLRTQADQKLDTVLQATVERILHGSVRRNPAELADHLFPVMGPAIRKSIAESLRGMLQDFSRLMEKSFSLTGLKWRLTALRTGRSFSEVALLHNLEYQVEQVFFVHTQTGAPLMHLVNEGVQAKDASGGQVAAMFTALQQFVSDSFAEGALDDLTFGDLQISVVQGPEVYLACVVRGQAPPNLRRDMRDLLELLIVRLAEELGNFKGDLAPFQKSRHLLDGLLISRRKDEGRKLPPSAFLLPGLLAAVIFGLALHLGYQSRQSRLAAEAEAALQQGYVELEKSIYEETVGPGLYPVHVQRRPDGVWELTFLKDELAGGPEEKLAGLGLAPGQVSLNFLPYLSQDQELVERRAALILTGRPETLACNFDWADQTLTLSGRADLGWVLAAHNALRSLPGLKAALIKGLVDGETGLTADLDNDKVLRLSGRASIRWLEPLKEKVLTLSGVSRLDLGRVEYDAESLRLKELLERLNNVVIYFPVDQDQPIPENRDLLRQTAEDLVALEKLAEPMGLTVSLAIYGYTDRSGQTKHNYELSQARARALAALLYEQGSAITLSTFGLGPDPALDTREEKKAAAQARRRIELKVKLDRGRAALNLD